MAQATLHRERDEKEKNCIQQTEEDCQKNQVLQCICQVNDRIEDFFEAIGRFIGKYPLYVLLGVLIILFGCCFGLFAFTRETDVFNLWTPTNSPTFDERKFVREYWADFDFGNVIIAAVDKDDSSTDILHESYVAEWHGFLMTIYAQTPQVNWTYEHYEEPEEEDGEGINSTRWSLFSFFGDEWKEPESIDALREKAEQQQDGYASNIVPFCRPFATSPLESQFQLPCYMLSIMDCFSEGGYIFPYEEYLAKSFLASIIPDNPYKYLPSYKGLSSVELGAIMAPSCTAWTGTRIPDNFIYGGIERVDSDDTTSTLTELKGFQAILFSDSGYGLYRKRQMLRGQCHKTSFLSIECNAPTDEQLEKAEKMLHNYFEEMIDFLIDFIDDWDSDDDHHLTAGFWTPRTGSDLLKSAAAADFLLLGVAYVAMIVFAGLSFLKPNDMYLSRSEASSCGVLIVLCSVVATFGLASLVVKFSPNVIQVLPFIALGFGVDDMFVILSAFWFNEKLPPEEMTAEALKVAGSSVALTSVANFFAFMVASFMPLPDVARFATVGMIVVALNWFSVVFGFTAVVALTATRMKKGYKDWGCCVCYQYDCAKAEKTHSEKAPHEDDSMFDPLFDWLSQDTNRLCSIFAFFALAAVGAYGASLAKVGLPLADIMPENTYARDYLTIKEKYFHGITNLWFSDAKGKNLNRIDWKNKFANWLEQLDQLTDMSDKVVTDLSQHSFWAWGMRSYFIDGHAVYFSDDGYSLEPALTSAEEVIGRSSDCESARLSLCPSLDADYDYGSDLYDCLVYNTALIASAECRAYLAEVAPAPVLPSIANQVEVTNVLDDSVNGIYMAPSSDTSLVFYREDGAVLFRRKDYTWLILNANLEPQYYSQSTDVAGDEPPQQAWYSFDSDERWPMTVVVYDLAIYVLNLARSDDFLVGDLSPRTTVSVAFEFDSEMDSDQSCYAAEIAQILLIQNSAYSSVTLSGDDYSVGCGAVLESSDVCYGYAADLSVGTMECGEFEFQRDDEKGFWWQGQCSSDSSTVDVIAYNQNVNLTENDACYCFDENEEGQIYENTTVFGACGSTFGGIHLDEKDDCGKESEVMTLSCEVFTDCSSLEACFEFIQNEGNSYYPDECSDQRITAYSRSGRTLGIAKCLLPLYSLAPACCQSAIQAEILADPENECKDFKDDIEDADGLLNGVSSTNAQRLADVCDTTDFCDSSCETICYDSMLSDCFDDIQRECISEYVNDTSSEFESCMDSADLSDCCDASYNTEKSTYAGCMLPIDSYWDYGEKYYDFNGSCDGDDISEAGCDFVDEDDEAAVFDCLVANQTSLSNGCCLRMVAMSTPQFLYTRDCQGDTIHYCSQNAAEVDSECIQEIGSQINSEGETLSDNCNDALTHCISDGTFDLTAVGDTATADCDSGYEGSQTRMCMESDSGLVPYWGDIDDSECTILRCEEDTLNGQTYQSIPVFNVVQYIGISVTMTLSVDQLCNGATTPSVLRRCTVGEDNTAVWEEPQYQCRGWYTQWNSVVRNYGCNDTEPQNKIFELQFDLSVQSAEKWEEACQTQCNTLRDHCFGYELLYDYGIESLDSGNMTGCIGYDYCYLATKNTASGNNDFNYTWQANTMTLMEFTAERCSTESGGEIYPPDAWNASGIPYPACWNRTLWQYMVDPTGGVLRRDSFLVNDQSILYNALRAQQLELISSSNSLTLRDIEDDVDAVEYLLDMRQWINKRFVKNDLFVIPSGLVVSLYTQYIGVADYMAENLGYVSITIVITGIVFLLHPVAVFLVLLCDFAMLLEIYGFADWIGLRINGVLALNIVIAVGLTMEFTAHMARAFMLAQAHPGEKIGIPGATEAQIRLKKTYREMFTPVTLGAITTILGVAPISAATFPYFRAYYFSLYVFIVMFGWINGVIFLPIMLSLANPHPWAQNEERRTMQSMSRMSPRPDETEMSPMMNQSYEPAAPTQQESKGTAANTAAGEADGY